ncbi:MAG: HD-GYP domain-containing protein [Magnetococcales bacterium]|nr:HD-GYP domain-containing protein [Magnetococcales bacterium]
MKFAKNHSSDSSAQQSKDDIEAMLLSQLDDLGDGITETGPVETVSEEVIWSETAKASNITSEAMNLAQDILVKIKKNQSVKVDPLARVTKQMFSSFSRDKEALTSLAMLKYKDNHLFNHSVQVSIYMLALAKKMGFSEKDQIMVSIGGLLQDVGLAKLPKDILQKKGKLTANERKFVQMHVDFGIHVIKSMDDVSPLVINILTQHHERLDGTGYPKKLRGGSISREGRMAAVVDSFAAITSKRSYRKQLENHVALRAIMKGNKEKYDMGIVQNFIQCVGVFPVGSTVKLADGTICVVVRNNVGDLLHPIVRPVVTVSGSKLQDEKLLNLLFYKQDKTKIITGHVDPGKAGINPLDYLPNSDVYR